MTADEVVVTFRAQMDQYKRELRSSTAAFEAATQQQQKQMAALERQIKASSNGIAGSLKGLAASFAAAFSIQQIAQMADGFTRVTNALKVAGLEGSALKGVQDTLLAQSQKYGVELEALAQLYGNVSTSAKELGATSEDLTKLTEYTAQALKISGTSTVAASGAILGLNQALASGRVAMEEFNQMNEGGLRPLLQAAANSEQFGGSISKLRNYMKDTGISGAQFYQMIIDGSAGLEGKANKAVLTLSGGLTALSSSFMVYIGEADQVYGASAAIGQAFQAIGDNLDVLIPAIVAIATAMGVNYVVASTAAAISTVRLGAAATGTAGSMGFMSAALFAVQARMVGAATTAEALKFAMAGLASAGGLVTIAITALVLGLGYLAMKSAEAEAELAAMDQRLSETAAKTKDLENRMREAGVQVDDTTQSFADAMKGAGFLGQQLQILIGQYDGVAQSAKEAAAEVAKLAWVQDAANYRKLRQADVERANSNAEAEANAMNAASRGGPPVVPTYVSYNDKIFESPATRKAREQVIGSKKFYDLTLKAPDSVFEKPKTQAAVVKATKPKATAAKRTPKGASGPSQAELDAAYAADMRGFERERLNAEMQITSSLERQKEIRAELRELERQDAIARVNANKDLTKAQRTAQLGEVERLYGPGPQSADSEMTQNLGWLGRAEELAVADREDRRKNDIRNAFNRRELEIAQARYDSEKAGLALSLEMATSNQERYAIEREMLALDEMAKRKAIETADLDDAIKAQKLKQLDAETALSQTQLDRAYENPLQSYARDIAETGNDLNTTFGGIAVDGLQSLNDGITDAIMGAKNLGDVFSDVAKSIIADLVRIAVQQMIIKPLVASLGVPAFNSGGSMTLPAFASGGSMMLGGNGGIDKNVLSMNGRAIARVSKGEMMTITNPALTSARGGGGGVTINQYIDAKDSIASPDFITFVKQTARDEATRAGGQAVKIAGQQAPSMVAKQNRYG